MNEKTAYQLRIEGSSNNVYLIKVNGAVIPRDLQRVVFTHRARDRSQVICDALNNGLVLRIAHATRAAERAGHER